MSEVKFYVLAALVMLAPHFSHEMALILAGVYLLVAFLFYKLEGRKHG